jgi:hypothetical protein
MRSVTEHHTSIRSRESEEVYWAYRASEGQLAGTFVRTLLMALGWAALWATVPHAFGVWIVMLLVYLGALGSVALTDALWGKPDARAIAWRARFFRTAGWLVVSGVLSVLAILVYVSITYR